MKRLFTVSLFIVLLVFLCCAFGEDDYVIAQLGDSGADVEIVLSKCHELGFLDNLPQNADEYLEMYIPAITRMENALGLTEDGIIWLSEFEELEPAIGPGSSGEAVSEVLERLYQHGIIKKVLPKVHATYDEEYISAVKSMERKLGLNEDGILTKSEQEKISNEPLPELSVVKSINVKYSKGDVTLSWKAVQNATGYIVYRDSSEIGRVNENQTSYVDKECVDTGKHDYSIRAVSYFTQSGLSDKKYIQIPAPQSIEFRDRQDKSRVIVTNGRQIQEAKQLRYTLDTNHSPAELKIVSATQQQLSNESSRFRFTFFAPAGYYISVFNPPNGDRMKLLSQRKTTNNYEEIVFDVTNSFLSSISYTITIKFYRNDDRDHYYIFPAILRPD